MTWYIFTPSFLVLVNANSLGFFHSSGRLRQGDPLLPYLFMIGMEAVSSLINKAMRGGLLSDYKVRGRAGKGVQITHLLFVDDTLVFCEAFPKWMVFLSWLLMWFEAILGLKINLDKSEILLMGRVENVEDLALELGCKVEVLPFYYLGLPLGEGWEGEEIAHNLVAV